MKKRSKKPLYLPIAVIAVAVIAVLVINLFIMIRMNGSQTEELGRMRIELVAADLQNRLGVCTESLNKIGTRLSERMEQGYTEEDLRNFLSEEKKKEIASTGKACLNIFCATPDGCVLISDMATPEDYVLQDRDWYKALMSALPTRNTYRRCTRTRLRTECALRPPRRLTTVNSCWAWTTT